jgi:hypothetical protein
LTPSSVFANRFRAHFRLVKVFVNFKYSPMAKAPSVIKPFPETSNHDTDLLIDSAVKSLLPISGPSELSEMLQIAKDGQPS